MLKNKKILFKIGRFPQVSETFVVGQIITAINCGHQVKVLTNSLNTIEGESYISLFNQYEIREKVIIEDYNIPENKYFRIIKGLFLLILNFRFIKYIVALRKELNRNDSSVVYYFNFFKKFRDFHIIHVQFGNNHQPFEILKKIGLNKSKLIVSFHGHDAFFPIHGFIEEGFYDKLFKYGDLIIANTPYLAKQIIKIGCPEAKLKTIPVPIDTRFFKPGIQTREQNDTYEILTVGRLDKVKGHKYAIYVLENLINDGFNVRLTIIGEGEERKELGKIIKVKGLVDSVLLLGKMDQYEIREYYQKSDLYIFCGVPVENGRRESQGLATLEAQACGLPVVVFDSGGVKYTVRDKVTGFIVPEYDITEMTEKVKVLFRDIELRSQMGENAINFVIEKYSLEIVYKHWCKVYMNLK